MIGGKRRACSLKVWITNERLSVADSRWHGLLVGVESSPDNSSGTSFELSAIHTIS
jgi:hypothetical protein